MSAESKTPRVDGWCELAVNADMSAVLGLARQLETELNEAKAALEKQCRVSKGLLDMLADSGIECKDLRSKLTELRKIADGLAEAALPISKCEPTKFRSVTPRYSWLWKPSSSLGDVQGINAQHVIDCKAALTAYEQFKKDNAI